MCSILIVEDSAIIREPMTKLLRFEGYDVVPAANGIEALAILKQRSIDLILLDVMMPRMSGITLLEKIRASPAWHKMPVVAMTGVMDSGQLGRLCELRVRSILAKGGFTFENLLREIHSHAPALTQ